jgi:hypothetical protein
MIHIRRFLFFAFILIALIAGLRFFNWLPSSLQEGLLRRYPSIEDVRAKLKLNDILVPSYFPQQYVWPPSEIVAQTKPFVSVVMKFRRDDGKPDALVICETDPAAPIPDSLPVMAQVRENTYYRMKGRTTVLDVGICGHGEVCSRISWLEGRYRIAAVIYAPPFDLIRISESMIQ